MNRYFKFPEMWRQVLIEQSATAADWVVAVELLNKAKFSRVVKFSNERAAELGASPQHQAAFTRSTGGLGADLVPESAWCVAAGDGEVAGQPAPIGALVAPPMVQPGSLYLYYTHTDNGHPYTESLSL
jgi:hypothetical protein